MHLKCLLSVSFSTLEITHQKHLEFMTHHTIHHAHAKTAGNSWKRTVYELFWCVTWTVGQIFWCAYHVLLYEPMGPTDDALIKMSVHCISALRTQKTSDLLISENRCNASPRRVFARYSRISALFCSRFVYGSSYAIYSTEVHFNSNNIQLSKPMRRPK